MRVDWCVSSWFRIKNTHTLTLPTPSVSVSSFGEHAPPSLCPVCVAGHYERTYFSTVLTFASQLSPGLAKLALEPKHVIHL